MIKWINLYERLPRFNKEVLLWIMSERHDGSGKLYDGSIGYGARYGTSAKNWAWQLDEANCLRNPPVVTHWAVINKPDK